MSADQDVLATRAQFVAVTGTSRGEMAAVSEVSMMPALLFRARVPRYITGGVTPGP